MKTMKTKTIKQKTIVTVTDSENEMDPRKRKTIVEPLHESLLNLLQIKTEWALCYFYWITGVKQFVIINITHTTVKTKNPVKLRTVTVTVVSIEKNT